MDAGERGSTKLCVALKKCRDQKSLMGTILRARMAEEAEAQDQKILQLFSGSKMQSIS